MGTPLDGPWRTSLDVTGPELRSLELSVLGSEPSLFRLLPAIEKAANLAIQDYQDSMRNLAEMGTNHSGL